MFNKRALNLKRKLRDGGVSPGIWVSIPSATTAEIVAGTGFDWVVVDSEHTAFNPETLHYVLMAFKGSETVPILRVPWNDHVMIKQALDMGWDGIVIPQVNRPEEAEQAVFACRYPPLGSRGFGPRRAGNYYRDLDEYVTYANDSVICVIQIEDAAAAGRIDQMVGVPGIDWIFVGPCDMSATTSKFLNTESPEVWNPILRIFDAAQKAGIAAGNALCGMEHIEKTLALGCPLVAVGEDTLYLKQMADRALEVFRSLLEKRGMEL